MGLLSEAKTAQLREICPSVLSPDRLVRYTEDLRITCPSGTLEPSDVNNHDVVGAITDALMEAGDQEHHMLKDKVHCCSKRSLVVGMTGTTDVQTLARVCGAWINRNPTFNEWLEAVLAKLASCGRSHHDRGIICTGCNAFSARRARQLRDKVLAVQSLLKIICPPHQSLSEILFDPIPPSVPTETDAQILRTGPLRRNHRTHAAGHALRQLLGVCITNRLPLFLHHNKQLVLGRRRRRARAQATLQLGPGVLDGVDVGTLSDSLQHLKPRDLLASISHLRDMARSQVLRERSPVR